MRGRSTRLGTTTTTGDLTSSPASSTPSSMTEVKSFNVPLFDAMDKGHEVDKCGFDFICHHTDILPHLRGRGHLEVARWVVDAVTVARRPPRRWPCVRGSEEEAARWGKKSEI